MVKDDLRPKGIIKFHQLKRTKKPRKDNISTNNWAKVFNPILFIFSIKPFKAEKFINCL